MLKFFHYFYRKILCRLTNLTGIILTLLLALIIAVLAGYFYLAADLPDVETIDNIPLQTPLRIYTKEGKLIEEFGEARRIPIAYDKIPPQLIHAIIATEDQRFYDHPGVDPIGLVRAGITLVSSGRKKQGGSTITMQVARNYFLTNEKTYTRKLKEIILAMKLSREFSKEKILDLYLNKIYLGNRAYGVGAAAQIYYGKPLSELNLAQMAMLAGLPKAPSSINPIANPKAAIERRSHVLGRMLDQGYIDQATYHATIKEPLTASYHGLKIEVKAPYVAEIVRQELSTQFGDDAYTIGLSVYTTINAEDQQTANHTLEKGLLDYSLRHGYLGAETTFVALPEDTWSAKIKEIPTINGLIPAVVTQVNAKSLDVLTNSEETIQIPWSGLSWARANTGRRWLGRAPKKASDIAKLGNVIRIQKDDKDDWRLTQIPKVGGSLIALNPQDGAIDALVGGFSYTVSKFNRATQAKRQPGSSFKPFIYSAALNEGYTLATLVNDAPVVYEDSGANRLWRPQNDSRKFYGPTRLRVALSRSRNLVTIRLLRDIGIPTVIEYLSRFGFNVQDLPNTLSLALGTGLTTPMEMTTGFAVFANGGYKVEPYLIDQIKDANDELIYQASPVHACPTPSGINTCQNNPQFDQETLAPQVITPQNAFLISSALQDVIRYGTGRKAKVLKLQDVAGKTGSTNEFVDAWFVGFGGDIVVSAWVGFDTSKSLYEYGGQAALPIWIDFMQQALKDRAEHTLATPPDIVSVRIDSKTGVRANAGQKNTTFEFFRKQYVPENDANSAESPLQQLY